MGYKNYGIFSTLYQKDYEQKNFFLKDWIILKVFKASKGWEVFRFWKSSFRTIIFGKHH